MTSFPQDLITRSIESYVEVTRQLALSLPGGSVSEGDGFTLIATGLEAAHYNPLFITSPSADSERAFAEARSFFGRLGLPFRVTAFGDAGRKAAAVLSPRLGFAVTYGGMLLAPIRGELRGAPGLTVTEVGTEEALRTFHDLCALGFGSDRASLRPLDSLGHLRLPNVARYLGYVGGVPVATSMRCSSGGIAVVFNVVTAPGYQRRGFGEAMTLWANVPAREEGCVASFLHATPMGRPLYERMGYRSAVDIHIWPEGG